MSVRLHYNNWSSTYDTVENRTRDLEAVACRQVLADIDPDSIIELGCGTGKNTAWLATRASHVTAVDFSEEMLAKAREKITAGNVVFQQADITAPWDFTDRKTDLVSCSLVLEHIADLRPVFQNAYDQLKEGGWFYACELHPFKQYTGSKARFETATGTEVLECHIHHISDYLSAAVASGFRLQRLDEWFDDTADNSIPRLVSFLFIK